MRTPALSISLKLYLLTMLESSFIIITCLQYRPHTIYMVIHTTLHYTTLHYTILHYTTLHYTTLHYTTLHYTTLHYTTPPRFWCLRAANRPPGVFFSTSGVIGTPKKPQKTDPITKKEKVCRFYENRVVWALSCVFLNVFVRQTQNLCLIFV